MNEKKVWATSEDGTIEYVSITKYLVQPSLEAMQRSFYVNENVCVAFGMPDQPESFPEMDILLVRALEDGVSIAAVEKSTGKVVGAAINKLEEPGQIDFFPEFIKSCQHSASRNVARWMLDIEKMFNMFEHCHADSVMEIMFLSILPEFRKRGIAKKLFEVSIALGKRLKRGEDAKVSLGENKVTATEKAPQFITAICSSFITQKIAQDLNFSSAVDIDFNKFVYDGVSLGSLMGSDTPHLAYEYLAL